MSHLETRVAKLSDLVEAVSTVTGWPEGNVGLYARHAREAGHIIQGARGNAAPNVSARDAASLLVALLGSDQAKLAADSIKAYKATESELARTRFKIFDEDRGPPDLESAEMINYDDVIGENDVPVPEDSLEFLPKPLHFLLGNHSFFDAIHIAIELAATGELQKLMSKRNTFGQLELRISCAADRVYATIDIIPRVLAKMGQFTYGTTTIYRSNDRVITGDLWSVRFISSRTIFKVGELLR